MKLVLLILTIVILVLIERKWEGYVKQSLSFSGKCDRLMAEPDQIVTWTSTVTNNGNLPVPYVRMIQRFSSPSKPEESPEWIRKHCIRIVTRWRVDRLISLLPGKSMDLPVRFSVPSRGKHAVGGCNLSTGDILGLKTEEMPEHWDEIVVLPRRCDKPPVLDAVGGFLGDVSVRRFIMEDPVLTVGFREYTGREPMKAISWTRSASSGTLQVRQYDHTAEQHLVVLLNVEDGTEEQLEECFSVARTVCEELERKKIPYGFRTNGSLPNGTGKVFHLPKGLGAQHLNTILYGLGAADYTCFESFRRLSVKALRSRSIYESYIVITPPLSDAAKAAADTLSQAVGGRICVLECKEEVRSE